MNDLAPLLLGIDVGSTRTKAVLVDESGEVVHSSVVPTPFRTGAGGTEATVDGLRDALGQALRGVGDGIRRVAAVGIAGMAESGAPLGASGEPLAPIIAWHDSRGEEVAERVAARFGPELGRGIGQRLRYVSTVAKLGWLLDNGLARLERWLGVPELCLHALTGASATEHSLAARTGCWDIGQRSWLPEVADAAGFSVDVFPDVLPAGSAMGSVSAAGAAWSDVPAGVPVTIAGHDHLAGVVGSGAAPNDLANSVGTAETVIGRSPSLPDVAVALDRGVAVTVFPSGDGWAALASAARAGLALESAAASLDRSVGELDGLAAGTRPLDAPDLLESLRQREPPALPDGPPGRVWATLLDALAATTEEAVAQVASLLGPAPRLVIFGGGAQSTPWAEAKARRLGLPVLRSVTSDAVARGAALFGGVAGGWWPSPAAAPAPPLEAV